MTGPVSRRQFLAAGGGLTLAGLLVGLRARRSLTSTHRGPARHGRRHLLAPVRRR